MTIGTFRVLDLDELIRQKKISDRPKGRAMLELLEEALRQQMQRAIPHKPGAGLYRARCSTK